MGMMVWVEVWVGVGDDMIVRNVVWVGVGVGMIEWVEAKVGVV